MPKVKISEYSATANSNTDVASINIDEGCAPSGINNAIRAIMGHLKDFQQGTNGDPFNGPVNGTVGATTPSTGAFTTLSSTGNSNFATSSGSVGVGTSSPASKISASGSSATDFKALTLRNSNGTTGSTAVLNFESSAGTEGDAGSSAAQIKGIREGAGTNGALSFWTSLTGTSAERARIDSAGNFGLGVTPSANAGQKTLSIANQTGSFAALTMGSNFTQAGYIGYNMGNTGTNNTWRYISADTGSALYFAGNEMRFMLFPAGTAGATTSGTQAMTLNANGALALQGASTSANGVGITFPATQSASSDANTLDDYEEGTFDPTITRSGTNPTVTYTNQLGSYVKVGRLVSVTLGLSWSANSGGSGNFTISGLPFTNTNSADNYSQAFAVDISGITFAAGTTTLGGYVNVNTTTIFLTCAGSAVSSSAPTLGSSGYLYMSVTYMASA